MMRRIPIIAAALGFAALLSGCGELPPMEVTQSGYRGTGMVQVRTPELAAYLEKVNAAPEVAIPLPPDEGPRASEAYQNVQVLGNISQGRFLRLMSAITEWVVPEEVRLDPASGGGCNYCHNPQNLASDEVYAKVVSRRMLQMTYAINTQYSPHVGATGVTCYTCHRGKAVPEYVWSTRPDEKRSGPFIAGQAGQNDPDVAVAYSSLPYDPFTPYLRGKENIRVQGPQFPTPQGASIKQTEQTYGLMMHMSNSLGVNCTFCHNTNAFSSWENSNVQRTTAWHGIRMVQTINAEYIHPLTPVWAAAKEQWNPAVQSRLGPLGDPWMANCTTCHQGLNKPLNGAPMLADYPSLAGAVAWPPGSEPAAPDPALDPVTDPAAEASPPT